jgi:6-phosphofructokinase 1
VKERRNNLLIVQGGGPTPVFNTTLCGAIKEARALPRIRRVLGATFGLEGLRDGRLVELTGLSLTQLRQLRLTPGAALGSTRYVPTDDDLLRILHTVEQFNVRWLVFSGGNGSLRGAHAISEAARDAGQDVSVIVAPKTIDNDIVGTDRCPGYGSAARYVAQAVRDLGADVRSLPQPVSIFETMGRGAGWLTAASVLGKRDEADAPHLVYFPERPFDPDAFCGDIDRVVRRHGWAVVVVAEGLRRADGGPVYETPEATQRDDCGRALCGNVSAYLAEVVTRTLRIRCRTEKPGLCGRASILHIAAQDQYDADLVGRAAVREAVAGRDDAMISLRPLGPFQRDNEYDVIPLATAVAGGERVFPVEWLPSADLSVNPAFLRYANAIVGKLTDSIEPLATLLPPAAPEITVTHPRRVLNRKPQVV